MRSSYVLMISGWVILSAVGCAADNQDSAGATGGDGGAPTELTGGSGGTGGKTSSLDSGAEETDASTGEDTLDSVCRAAILAQCQRRFECEVDGALECYGYADLCPEYYFGPDSTRTLEGMRDCIPAIQQMSCTDVELGAFPGCLLAGARTVGTACAYGSQCASAFCDGAPTQCGTCSAAGQVGMPCNDRLCEAGSFCHQDTSCEASASIVHGDEGETCDLSQSPVLGCTGDLVCVTQGTTLGTCTRFLQEGEACSGSVSCAPELVCANDGTGNGVCKSLRHCGTTPCDGSSYCNHSLTPEACVPLATEGQPCMLSGDTGQIPCIAGTVCVGKGTGGKQGLCLKPLGVREVSCTDSAACPFPLQCSEGHCAPPDVSSCKD